MRLDYRLADPGDLPGVQDIWEEAGWGRVPPEQWREWTEPSVAGVSILVLAVDADSGRILGWMGFFPTLVRVDGRELRAYRPSAPIVGRGVKATSIKPDDHPSVKMYLRGLSEVRALGDGLIYMVPHPGWLPFLRMMKRFKLGSFPLWQMPVPLAAPLDLPVGYTATPLSAYDGRVNALWEKSARLYGCQVVRDARTLPLKARPGEYDLLAIERAGELVGLSTSRLKGDRQWLICDVLTADLGDSLLATVAATCNLADRRAREAPPGSIHKTAILTTRSMEPVVHRLGFVRDDYDFPIGIQVLSGEIADESISPERWYVSAND